VSALVLTITSPIVIIKCGVDGRGASGSRIKEATYKKKERKMKMRYDPLGPSPFLATKIGTRFLFFCPS
jgi:hypothetical protein